MAAFFLYVSSQKPHGTFRKMEELADSEAGEIHSRKMQGLYVDYEDGVIYAPSDISFAQARELVDEVATALNDSWLSEIELYLDIFTIIAEKMPAVWRVRSELWEALAVKFGGLPDALSEMMWDLRPEELAERVERLRPGLEEELTELGQELWQKLEHELKELEQEVLEELRQEVMEKLGQEKVQKLLGVPTEAPAEWHEWHVRPRRLCLAPAPVRLCLLPAPVRRELT